MGRKLCSFCPQELEPKDLPPQTILTKTPDLTLSSSLNLGSSLEVGSITVRSSFSSAGTKDKGVSVSGSGQVPWQREWRPPWSQVAALDPVMWPRAGGWGRDLPSEKQWGGAHPHLSGEMTGWGEGCTQAGIGSVGKARIDKPRKELSSLRKLVTM